MKLSKPRFYIDTVSYLQKIFSVLDDNDIIAEDGVWSDNFDQPRVYNVGFQGAATQDAFITDAGNRDAFINIKLNPAYSTFRPYINPDNAFAAVFNHQFKDGYEMYFESFEDGVGVHQQENYKDLINWSIDGDIAENGWSLCTFKMTDYTNEIRINLKSDVNRSAIKLGSFAVGNYYDIQSPDINMTYSKKYESPKSKTALDGTEYTNSQSLGIPYWHRRDGNLNAIRVRPFSIYGTNDTFIEPAPTSGRRVYKLTFSALDEKDLFPANETASINSGVERTDLINMGFDEGDVNPSISAQPPNTPQEAQDNIGIDIHNNYERTQFSSTLETDSSFISQCWQKTLGGQIPFMLQLDRDRDTPDQFMFARFVSNSLSIERTSPSTHRISVEIEEAY